MGLDKLKRRARNQQYVQKQNSLAFDGVLLRKVPLVKQAYYEDYVVLRELIDWSG